MVEGVGAFIFAKDTERYLFLLRNGKSWPLTWSIPGGKIEFNETLQDGLAREIQEELGGRLIDPELIFIDQFISANKNFRYTSYFVSVESEFVPFLNDEHIGYAWLPLSAAPRPLHPGIIRTLACQPVMEKIKIAESSN